MKTLTLLRHAKSGWDDPTPSDFARPLNARGRGAARAMGQRMLALGLAWDRILASPDTLLALVRATDDIHATLLVVGHNPGMERLALLLSRGGPLHDELALKYPTGALAEIALPVDHWRDVAESAGTLSRFLRPRDLE